MESIYTSRIVFIINLFPSFFLEKDLKALRRIFQTFLAFFFIILLRNAEKKLLCLW